MALAAHAVDVALSSGEPLPRACASVADALTRQGHALTKGGKPITGNTVMGWRAELMKGPGKYDVAVKTYCRLSLKLPAAGAAPRGAWKSLIKESLPKLLSDLGLDVKKLPS